MIISVAIPVRDEADHIGPCLNALNAQVGARIDHIVLLVNNSTDGTVQVARSARLRRGTRLHVIETTLPPELANAGHARRLAMDTAANLAGPHGIVMTTDADGLVDSDWTSATLAAFSTGVDAVAGWAELHPIDWGKIPLQLHEDDARECAYDVLCDEIHSRLDPDPFDPMPRHTQASGASIAVTVQAYRRCGGVPPVACGEDRALIAALRRVDARIRHAPEVHVMVSGRTVGRAIGGMADTIRRRLDAPDEFLDPRLEPALDCARRASARGLLRAAYDGRGGIDKLTHLLALEAHEIETVLRQPFFGLAWHDIEQTASMLKRRPIAATEVAAEMRAASGILTILGLAKAYKMMPMLEQGQDRAG